MITANSIPIKLSIFSLPQETEIYFGSALETLKGLLREKNSKIALITDENLQQEYHLFFKELDIYRNDLKNREFGKEAPQNFDSERVTIAERQGASEDQNSETKPTLPKTDSSGCFGIKVFAIPPGEIHKARQTKELLEDALFAHQFGRDSIIIALGGGVVMDVAGFVAATFCRGVPLILIPTTLLGMVDACLGGKTAVNTPHGKNLIGSFYFPESIIIDTDFLNTLPAKQLLNGIAEMIKYGLIHSRSLFEKLEAKYEIKELIYECLAIKKEVIESDPYEKKGRRRILNFGHTIGHALETLENYQIEHGEAIGIGMILESYLSMKLQFLEKEEYDRIVAIFHNYKFPLKLSRCFTLDDMLIAFTRDKKAIRTNSRFVLLKTIGQVMPFDGEYCTPVDLKLIEEALELL